MGERKTIPEWLEEAFEEISGLRNDVVALNQEVVRLRRELETERRLRLAMKR